MSGNSPLDQDGTQDAGACLTAPGSREPSPGGLGPSGFDPSRKMSVVERDQEVRQACEIVRAAARRLTVLGWGNSAGDLARALETIEIALAGDCEVNRG